MKAIVMQHAAYNVWANTRMVELLKKQDHLLDKEVKSSFPTLRKTVFHIWDAEYIWLQRLKGQSIDNWPSKLFDQRISLDKLVLNSKEFHDFLQEKDEDYYTASTGYRNTRGESFSNTNHGIAMHCMNHSTFHRGQAVTMLRSLGYEDNVDSTDLIAYLRETE